MMIKKIFVVFVLVLLASCGSKKKASQSKRYPEKEVVKETSDRTGDRERETQTLESTSRTTVYTETVEDYIRVYSPIAVLQMREFGVPASITLSQGILESGAGKGELVRKANNHFGIKCHTGWQGDRAYHDDDAKGECFRKYDYAELSFADHSRFLTTRSRYAFLFDLKADDYKGWARGLRKAGYATDRRYPEKLISLIERYRLYEYDDQGLGKKSRKRTNTSGRQHVVSKGDTLYSISRRHNISVDELKRKNDLRDNTIHVGQILYLN